VAHLKVGTTFYSRTFVLLLDSLLGHESIDDGLLLADDVTLLVLMVEQSRGEFGQ
jgi:hypothetical protein